MVTPPTSLRQMISNPPLPQVNHHDKSTWQVSCWRSWCGGTAGFQGAVFLPLFSEETISRPLNTLSLWFSWVCIVKPGFVWFCVGLFAGLETFRHKVRGRLHLKCTKFVRSRERFQKGVRSPSPEIKCSLYQISRRVSLLWQVNSCVFSRTSVSIREWFGPRLRLEI